MTTPYDHSAGQSFPSDLSADPFGQPVSEEKNSLALVGMILGIVNLFLTVTVYGLVLSWLTGIIGVVVNIIALVKAKNYAPANKRKGMAVVGLILSILTVVVVALVGITIVALWTVIEPCLQVPDSQIDQCVNEQLNLQFQ